MLIKTTSFNYKLNLQLGQVVFKDEYAAPTHPLPLQNCLLSEVTFSVIET